MLVTFLTILEQTAQFFLFMVIGFGLNKLKILPANSGAALSKLTTHLLLPALILSSNITGFNPANIIEYGQLVLLGGVLFAVIAFASMPVAKGLSKGDSQSRGLYLYTMSFTNYGAIGIGLAMALYGTQGVFQFNLLSFVMAIMTYAWGIGLFLETKQKNPVQRFLVALLNPGLLSRLVGMALGAAGAKNWLPAFSLNVLSNLGNCFIPLSIVMAGYTIAQYPIKDVLRYPKSYFVTFLRLLLIPAIVLAAARLLGCSKEIAVLLMGLFATPCGMNIVIFPAAYGQDCRTGTSLVLLSNLFALGTVPLMIALLQLIYA